MRSSTPPTRPWRRAAASAARSIGKRWQNRLAQKHPPSQPRSGRRRRRKKKGERRPAKLGEAPSLVAACLRLGRARGVPKPKNVLFVPYAPKIYTKFAGRWFTRPPETTAAPIAAGLPSYPVIDADQNPAHPCLQVHVKVELVVSGQPGSSPEKTRQQSLGASPSGRDAGRESRDSLSQGGEITGDYDRPRRAGWPATACRCAEAAPAGGEAPPAAQLQPTPRLLLHARVPFASTCLGDRTREWRCADPAR